MNSEIRKHKVTYSLILICLLVYLYTFIRFGIEMNSYEGIMMGGYMPELVYYFHQYWRLITANFIHFGIIHLAVNCYSLRNIGCFIERIYHRKQYLFILLCSAFGTTFIPYLLYLLFSIGASTVSGGVSGIIFGLLGCLCVTAYQYKGVYYHVYRQLLPNIILMFIISICIPSISLFGHLGGFIGGMIGTKMVIYFIEKKKNKPLYN